MYRLLTLARPLHRGEMLLTCLLHTDTTVNFILTTNYLLFASTLFYLTQYNNPSKTSQIDFKLFCLFFIETNTSSTGTARRSTPFCITIKAVAG